MVMNASMPPPQPPLPLALTPQIVVERFLRASRRVGDRDYDGDGKAELAL
jgi:hypothetical protein